MKNFIPKAAFITMAVLAMAACRPDGTRRENGGNNEEQQEEETTPKYVENPNWTITYSGREVDTADGVYVVDPVYLKSSDNVSYFLDVVSQSEYKRTYSSDIQKLIEGDFKNSYDSKYLASGDSRAAFDALDSGEGNWVAIAYEVTGGKLGTKYAFCEFTTKAITMKEDKSYEITYNGREKYTEDDGSVSDVENFSIKANSEIPYYVEITYPEYLTKYYDGDPVSFFNDDLDYMAYYYLEDGEDFQSLLYSGDYTILFNRLRHGDWTAYAFGVDYYGNLTGNWSKLDFDIEEEEATEEFSKWLGTWKIGGKGYDVDGNSDNYFYNITISSAENNQYYSIQDWETGDDAEDYANEWCTYYTFESEFDPSTGNMIFNSQYLGSDSDDEIGDYDVCLLGNIKYEGEEYAITDIDFPLADAILGNDGTSADVKAREVTVALEDGNYETTFISMQYYDLTDDSIYYYNSGIPYFPMTMTKVATDDGTRVLAARKPLAVRRTMPAAKTASSSMAATKANADANGMANSNSMVNDGSSVTVRHMPESQALRLTKAPTAKANVLAKHLAKTEQSSHTKQATMQASHSASAVRHATRSR